MTDLATHALRDQLDQLLVTARRVAESLDLDTVLSSIVDDATTLLGADSGDILLWDRERDALRVVAVSNFPPRHARVRVPVRRRNVVTGDRRRSGPSRSPITRTYEHRLRALDRYVFGSVLCAPLLFRGAAIGAINVHARGRRHTSSRRAPRTCWRPSPGTPRSPSTMPGATRTRCKLGRDLAETNRELTRLLTVQQRLAEHVLLDEGPERHRDPAGRGSRPRRRDPGPPAPAHRRARRRTAAMAGARLAARSGEPPATSRRGSPSRRGADRARGRRPSAVVVGARTSARSIGRWSTPARPARRWHSPRCGPPSRSRSGFAARRPRTC